jgi:uncharacterized protein YndB with AHSA1/START domain
MPRELRFEATYAHPPEKVWRAITHSDAIARWLMPNDFAPVVGHRFQFRSKPMGGWDGVVNSEVLELDPPKRLAFTWTSNMLFHTVVAFDLEPTSDGGTRLRLVHSGFKGVKEQMISYILGSGWKGIVRDGIAKVAATL